MDISISHPSVGRTPQPNFTDVQVRPLHIWFSYRTPVAFRIDGQTHVRINEWGPTTGKHLNWIDSEEFARKLSTVVHGIVL